MKRLMLKVDYQTYFVCGDGKDEQTLLGILTRGSILKQDWQMDNAIYVVDEVPEIKLIDEDMILFEKPEPEPEQTGSN